MPVVAGNLTQGPAVLYHGLTTAVEPANTLTALNAVPGAGWTDVGGTQGGLSTETSLEYSELEVDQIVDVPGRRLTKRDMQVETNLAEPTIDNMVLALNGGTKTAGDATNAATYEPANDTSATQPVYRSLLADAWIGLKRRRVILRRVLSINNLSFAYQKDNQTVFSARWGLHYVSSSVAPYKIQDDTSV